MRPYAPIRASLAALSRCTPLSHAAAPIARGRTRQAALQDACAVDFNGIRNRSAYLMGLLKARLCSAGGE